jgi:hypothetical protein
VAALREDVAALSSLRHDLGQLGELRTDLGRLRAELSEQLSSEMLVERIVMRTQGARLESPGRPMDVQARWSEDTPPRELTGGWPAIRLDDPRGTQHPEPMDVDRPAPSHPVPPAPMWSTTPATTAFPSPVPSPAPAPAPAPAPVSRTSAFDLPVPPPGEASSRSRTEFADDDYAAPRPAAPPVDPHETPLEWLTARSLLEHDGPRPMAPPPVPPASPPYAPVTEARPAAVRPSPHPRPRPTAASPAVRPQHDPDPTTAERPMANGGSSSGIDSQPARDGGTGAMGVGGNDDRLAEILAENGVSPATGGRRRRRYREDDEPDDVLARVLGLS